MTLPPPAWVTTERFGRPVRHFPLAVSTDAQALAWARQEDAPGGAVVLADHEVSARGRGGRIWWAPADRTLAFAVVLRPPLSAEEGDLAWLLGGAAAAEGAEAASGRPLVTWWPDGVLDASSKQEVGQVKAEVQLGPGSVRSAVVTVRLDLERLGLETTRRDDVLEAVLGALDRLGENLGENSAAAAAAYEKRCATLGERVKIKLRPKGETRGTARSVDKAARLSIESTTGMVERIGLDQLRDLEVV